MLKVEKRQFKDIMVHKIFYLYYIVCWSILVLIDATLVYNN